MAEPSTTNDWCRVLGIAPPKLEATSDHPNGNAFGFLIVALLEHGGPLRLVDVALRFEAAGIAEATRALGWLQRCKPGRPPVFREGEYYHLDPHDASLVLWVSRLGLRPPKVSEAASVAVKPAPLSEPHIPLTPGELDEAWKDMELSKWPAARKVVAVLDAHGGPLTPAEVIAAIAARTHRHGLDEGAAKFSRRGCAVEVLADGRWALAADAGPSVREARRHVRTRIAAARRDAALQAEAAEFAARTAEWRMESAQHGAELANYSRALLVGFPPAQPRAVALLDVGEHVITTFVGAELAELPAKLAPFRIIGAIDVRGLLRALRYEPGEARLAELGPPQKSKRLNQRGRTLKITTALLVQGSCGIYKPFGDEASLASYLERGQETRLRRRLESDVKSLYALYEYGRLHGTVRLRWGFLEEFIDAPWVHSDEPKLYDLKKAALAMNVPLEVVVGSAPGWSEPWSRVRQAHVQAGEGGWGPRLIDEDGRAIREAEVQRAPLPLAVR